MSQTSFLEAVVGWDHNQCQQNVHDALPRLISQLHDTESVQEEIGILKIICQSFLPCVEIQTAEERVFSEITDRSCQVWDKLLVSIQDVVSHTQIQDDVLTLLQMLIEVLDCFQSCIQSVLRANNSVDVSSIHSLPYGSVHLLKGSYQHCKESTEVYGDMLGGVAEPLSQLFKKAHSLQVAFIGLLEKISVDSSPTEQDAKDLCHICQGLFEVCQIVTALDVKLMCSIWKTISRFSVRMKAAVKDDLDVDAMIVFLCKEISEGYQYLFQLAPPQLESQELVLSQGDGAAFQHSVKVLGYQMRILVSLLDSFSSTISSCENTLVSLVMLLQRNMPPNLSAPKISSTHTDNIQCQVLLAVEPLLSAVIGNRRFMENLTRSDKGVSEHDRLPYLLILLKILDILPRHPGEVTDMWIMSSQCQEDIQRDSVIGVVFKAAQTCYVELGLPVYLPGVMTAGKPQSLVSLYEYVCIHVCGFLGSFPARHFHILEEVLLRNLLNDRHAYSAVLAVDTWCFLARYGTADLCYSHIQLLLDLCMALPCDHVAYHLHSLIQRLIKFTEQEHQTDLVKQYPPTSYLKAWGHLPLSQLPAPVARETLDSVAGLCVRQLHNFINNSRKHYCDIEDVIVSLRCLKNVYNTDDALVKYLSPVTQRNMVEKLGQLWSSLGTQDWTCEKIVEHCLAELLDVTGRVLSQLQNTDILKILEVTGNVVSSDCDSEVSLALTQFLEHSGKMKFSPNPQQPQILHQLSVLFEKLLSSKNCVIRQAALQSFTRFAEQTVYESVVPDCMSRQPALQETVVAFLNKTCHESDGYTEETYLKQQLIDLYRLPDSLVVESESCNEEDTSQQQPASKKKRVEECSQVKLDQLVQALDTGVTELEKMCSKVLSASIKSHLQGLNQRLLNLLKKPG